LPDEVCTLTRDLPRGYFFLADQLNRAALSIAANIAEGNGRFTKPDRRNFSGIPRQRAGMRAVSPIGVTSGLAALRADQRAGESQGVDAPDPWPTGTLHAARGESWQGRRFPSAVPACPGIGNR